METPPPNPPADGLSPKRAPIVDLSMFDAGTLESVTKGVAAFVVCSYAVGFLVILIGQGHLGFIDASLLKPRAILAGATCIFLVALPLSLTRGAFYPRPEVAERPVEHAARVALGLADFLANCWGTFFIAAILYAQSPYIRMRQVQGSQAKPDMVVSVLMMVCLVTVAINGTIRTNVGRVYRANPRGWLIFSCILISIFSIAPFALWRVPSIRYLLWAFVTSVLFGLHESDWRRGVQRTFKVLGLVAVLLAVLTTYAQFIFPQLKSTWGGGAPVEALVTLPGKEPGEAGEEVAVQLYEATDAGYYVSLGNQSSVVFLPKASVVAIEYPPETLK